MGKIMTIKCATCKKAFWVRVSWVKLRKHCSRKCRGLSEKGTRRSIKTEFKKGERASINTEFKKEQIPWNKGLNRIKTKLDFKIYLNRNTHQFSLEAN